MGGLVGRLVFVAGAVGGFVGRLVCVAGAVGEWMGREVCVAGAVGEFIGRLVWVAPGIVARISVRVGKGFMVAGTIVLVGVVVGLCKKVAVGTDVRSIALAVANRFSSSVAPG